MGTWRTLNAPRRKQSLMMGKTLSERRTLFRSWSGAGSDAGSAVIDQRDAHANLHLLLTAAARCRRRPEATRGAWCLASSFLDEGPDAQAPGAEFHIQLAGQLPHQLQILPHQLQIDPNNFSGIEDLKFYVFSNPTALSDQLKL